MRHDKASDQTVPTPRTVKLPHHKLRVVASTLRRLHRPPPPPPPSTPFTAICISDTHCTQPPIPPGDILLHAGDLSVWGTYAEIQAQLDWLSGQPHRYKVIIAGNHDLLLDQSFRNEHPQRWQQAMQAGYGSIGTEGDNVETAAGLNWGNVIYLQNSSVTLTFDNDRQITIFGSPLTPQHGISAFQYLPSTDVWSGTIPRGTDIVLTHGPPRGHLDGFKRSGCAYLAREIMRVRPRLVVFGHIHVGYGIEERVYDRVERAHEKITGQWGGWKSVMRLAAGVGWGYLIPRRCRSKERATTFVNAAVVEGWEEHVVKNQAVVVQI